jgi:hypothetical protein
MTHYELTLKSYITLAKAAFPCGYADESKEVLNVIIEKAKSLDDKMEAYTLLVSIEALQDPTKAFKTCIEVLNNLGEYVADSEFDRDETNRLFLHIKSLFSAIPEGGSILLEEQENKGRESLVMYFYTQLATLAFRVNPTLLVGYISRYTAYALENKVKCKHTPNAIVHFASLLCSSLGEDTGKKSLQGTF